MAVINGDGPIVYNGEGVPSARFSATRHNQSLKTRRSIPIRADKVGFYQEVEMYTRARGLAISTILLAYGAVGAMAQDRMAPRPDQQQVQTQQRGANPMGQEGMIGGGMMGPGMMGPGMMGPPPIMLRMMLVLIDTDSDGAISLQEFQAAHERIFKAMDTNKDGKLTLEEMQTFMYGTR